MNMPDEQPTHWIERIFDKLLKFAGPILLAYLSVLATRNTVKVDTVEQKQVEAAEHTQTVKATLEAKNDKADKEAAKQEEATEATLYGTWKWLENVSNLSGSVKDADAAANAKRLYDEFAKKNKAKKP
jgi:plasmid replication initiation protein